jgi:plasmid stabilization system protein ParE
VSDPLPVGFTLRAARHVDEAARWWRDNRTKAPEAFAEALAQAIDLIASQPHVGAIARNVALPNVRRVLLGRVNYHLYYRVRDSDPPAIEVIAFWHASRGSVPPVTRLDEHP